MVVNFRVREISRGARKLARTLTIIIIIKKKTKPTKSKENKFLQKNKTGTALVGLLCFDLVP